MMVSRFRLYACASFASAIAMVWYAFNTRQQFYPAVIYMVTSKLSIAILGNFSLALVILFAKLLIKLFLGKLSHQELERVGDNVRFVIPETLFALTIFREQLGIKVVVLFAGVLFTKFFHWVMSVRVDELEVAVGVRRRDHVRLTLFITLLMITDAVSASLLTFNVLTHGPSVLIMFAFEEVLLGVSILVTFAKYVLHLVNAQLAMNWANKRAWTMYVRVMSELIRLCVYIFYFVIILTFYSIPLPIVRDLYTSARRLHKSMRELVEYRRINRRFSQLPNATAEELAGGVTCIVCRDEMDSAKKLPCGHMFHSDCLKSWLAEQQVCPICRTSLTAGAGNQPRDAMAPANDAAGPADAAPDGEPNADNAGAPVADNAHGEAQAGVAVPPVAVGGTVVAPRGSTGAATGAMTQHAAWMQQVAEAQVGVQPQPGQAQASVAAPHTMAPGRLSATAAATIAANALTGTSMGLTGAMEGPDGGAVMPGSAEALRSAEMQYLSALQNMHVANAMLQSPAAAPAAQPHVGAPVAPVATAVPSSPSTGTPSEAAQRQELQQTIESLRSLQEQLVELTAAARTQQQAPAATGHGTTDGSQPVDCGTKPQRDSAAAVLRQRRFRD